MKKVTVVCFNCGRQFLIYSAWLKKGKHKFCSKQCFKTWFSKIMKGRRSGSTNNLYKPELEERQLACPVCHKVFKIRGSNLKMRPNAEYCSNACFHATHKGEKHPFYRRKHTEKTKAIIRQKFLERMQQDLHRRPNKAELQLKAILDKHFPSEWQYTGGGSHIINGFIPDFTNCNGQKELIELYGDYWHTRRGIDWDYTELGRIMAYNSLGYRCLIIWEHELKDEQVVVTKIKQFNGEKGVGVR